MLNFIKKEDNGFQNDEEQQEIPKKVKPAAQKRGVNKYG
jgi:hypothetical protein